MPISRYEIRNEYTLADPDLYRAADKDDPEALLEGVAMAGLVGVLRQLGDLAEFAAEIFHDLHEEVMSTSARGHSLMTRVQQLETDVPLIEKAFLSQTDHSSFSYNTGVDWHPNLRMDQNLVTRGDLPRFVMDSYEECRGPPRLFLLDKYDVAGAGGCQKRYTDPSFFKLEISSFGMTSADVQRKKKVLKAKKKGSRWRNGDTTPEVLASHAKLDQLFMKESIENGVSYPARRMKLKRKLNGFPFGSKPGKSYMEKLLEITSIDDEVLHEVSRKSLILPTNSLNESDLEVVGGLMSPDRESMEGKRSPPSPRTQEIVLKPSMYKPTEVFVYNKISEAPNSSPDIVAEDNAFSHDKMTSDEDMAVDVGGGFTSYQPDDTSSEMENYVDAPSTVESEMDTDSELKVKSDFTSSFLNRQQLVSDANEETSYSNEEQGNTHSSDSHSTRNSTESNSGNVSSGKKLPTLSSSGSPRTSTENPESKCEVSDAIFPFTDIIDILPYHKTPQEDISVSQLSNSVIYNDTCPDTATTTDHESDLDQMTSCLTYADSTPTVPHSDLGVNKVGRSESNETSPLDQEEKRTTIVMDLPCSPSVSGMHSGYNSPRFSGADHLIGESDNESVHCSSTVSDNLHHTTTDFLHDHNSDPEDLNLGDSETSTLYICNALPQKRDDSLHMISIENLTPDKLDGGVPEKPENSITKYPDTDHSEDSFTATSEGGELIDELDNEDSFAFSDAPCIADACLRKEYEKTSVTGAENLDSEDYSNSLADKQLGSQNLLLLHVEHSHHLHRTSLDFQDRDRVLPDGWRTATETPAVGMLQVFEVELLKTRTTCDHVFSGDSTSAGTSYFVEKSKVTPSASLVESEVRESSPDPTNKVHVQFDAIDSRTQKSETAVNAISESYVADSKDDISLFVDLNKMVEESSPCFNDSGLDELRNDKSSFLGNHQESDLVERVGQKEAAASVLHSVVCNTMNCDKLESEISDIVPNSSPGSEVQNSLDFVNTVTIEPSLQQNYLGTSQESCQQSGLGNHPADAPAPSLTIGSHVKENIELLANQLDEEFSGSDEINSDPLPLQPINHKQMVDHDKCEGHSISIYSLVNCRNPPSMSNLPAQSNHVIDGSGLLKDSLSFSLPSNYPFSETNQINLEELPPLPPLPPVQWRMGKLQHASSASDGNTMKHTELSSLGISPATTSNDASSSHKSLNQVSQEMPRKEEKSEHSSSEASSASDGKTMKHSELSSLGISPSTTSNGASYSHEELNQSLNQVSQDMPRKEEKSDHGSSEVSSASDGKTMKHNELSSLGISPSTTSNDAIYSHKELNQSLNQVCQYMPRKEEKSEHRSSEVSSASDGKTMKNCELSSLGISPPTTSNDSSYSHEDRNQSLNQVSQDMPRKEEKSEHRSSEVSFASDGKTMKHSELSSLEISPPATSKDDASSLYAEMNQSQNQINQDMPTKEEKNEHSSSEDSSASDEKTMKHSELSSLEISPPTTSNDASCSHEDLNQSLNQVSQDMPRKEEKSKHRSSEASFASDGKTMKHSDLSSLGISPHATSKDDASSLHAETSQSLNQINQDMPTKEEKNEHSSSEDSSASDGKTMKHSEFSLGIFVPTTSEDGASSSREELNQSLNQVSQHMPRKEDMSEHSSSSLVASIMMPETIDLLVNKEIEQQQKLLMPSSNSGSMPLAVEDVSYGGQTVKLPRPRNPLIDAVTAVGKSKLRKVTERAIPELSKVDERDSILEQIRTKSFNLKPTLASRPSIRAPNTNLNVAAILEKANAIRQALVDSDEDEDNWSDS